MIACFRIAILLLSVLYASTAAADIVTTSTPAGTSDRVDANSFIGLLDNVTPTQIGDDVNFNGSIPTGESFQLGDLVGRDIGSTSGGTTWTYELILPGNATPGTGFTNISFSGRAFERDSNNLEGTDQVRWELYLNNDVSPVQTTGPAAGSDWSTFDVSLSDPGGSTVNRVRVVFTVTGFDHNIEWFATRGALQAEFQPIPEPSNACIFLLVFGVCRLRRTR